MQAAPSSICSIPTVMTTGLCLAILASAGNVAAERASVVADGVATPASVLKGEWRETPEGLVGNGLASTVETSSVVGPGDFTIVARLKVQDVHAIRGGLVFDDVSDFGIATPANPRLYVRGFLFGDLTQEMDAASDHVKAGEIFEMRSERRGDMIRCTVNGELIYDIPYESSRPLGKVAVRAGQTNMHVVDFWFEGNAQTLDGWESPYDRTYATMPNSVDVFTAGDDGYHTYRIPALVVSNVGTILAFAEGRKNSGSDYGDVDIVLRRSFDGGQHWEPMEMIYEEGDTERITIGNPAPVVDRNTGTIWLLFCRDNERVFVGSSKDNGKTWSERREITEHVKDPSWSRRIYTGPIHGLQLDNGRLLIPSYHGNARGGASSFMIMSNDAGATWTKGASIQPPTGEPTGAVLSTGQIMMNSRTPNRTWNRAVTISDDGGMTWGTPRMQDELIEMACQGTLLDRFSEEEPQLLLFSNPHSHRRERMTVHLSENDGATWTDKIRVYEGSSAYSAMTRTPDGNFGVLFERDIYKKITWTPFRLTDFPSRKP